ncbi:MAG: DUF3363 domain-containing protein [Rhodospirillum sp.]|nr:DUF3363 domain-containing protein [Rhodospirillum sp.]
MPSRRHRAVVGPFPTVRRTALLLLSGLLSGLSSTVPAAAQDASVERASPSDPYAGHIADAARRFGIPEAWIRAVMRFESHGDVRAISPKGAIGLMQIMPATWGDLRARHGLGGDPYDPRDNIMAGAAYLREMHDRYGSPGFLAAYNAGPGRYEEYRATGRPLPVTKAGTGEYVAGAYRQRIALASGRFAMIDDGLGFQLVPWSPSLEKHLGQQVSGVARGDGGVDWSFGRKRGLGL